MLVGASRAQELGAQVTWLLDFIHARKWLVELIVLGLIAGAVWWLCSHLIDVGVQQERARWEVKVMQAEQERARQQGRAETAEKAGNDERKALDDYIAGHPLHGSLCPPAGRLPTAASAEPGHAGSSAAAGDVLPLPAGDHRGDEGEPDQLHLLDLLAIRGDQVSATLREFQAR